MAVLFRNIPRDAETVAALRKACDRHGYPASCRERVCWRTRHCRGRWRADDDSPDIVLPPCLAAARIAACRQLADGDMRLVDLRLIVAEARKLPNPVLAAETDRLDLDIAFGRAHDPEEDLPW